jgi:transcriptional regulator with XRE-family HTH domain
VGVTTVGVVMAKDRTWRPNLDELGTFIRTQRRLANLTLRDMAELTNVSNPYLSQIERGLHEPSVRVLRSIARALNVSAETLLARAGLPEAVIDPEMDDSDVVTPTEEVIRDDPKLTDAQKEALLSVYRSFVR